LLLQNLVIYKYFFGMMKIGTQNDPTASPPVKYLIGDWVKKYSLRERLNKK